MLVDVAGAIVLVTEFCPKRHDHEQHQSTFMYLHKEVSDKHKMCLALPNVTDGTRL